MVCGKHQANSGREALMEVALLTGAFGSWLKPCRSSSGFFLSSDHDRRSIAQATFEVSTVAAALACTGFAER